MENGREAAAMAAAMLLGAGPWKAGLLEDGEPMAFVSRDGTPVSVVPDGDALVLRAGKEETEAAASLFFAERAGCGRARIRELSLDAGGIAVRPGKDPEFSARAPGSMREGKPGDALADRAAELLREAVDVCLSGKAAGPRPEPRSPLDASDIPEGAAAGHAGIVITGSGHQYLVFVSEDGKEKSFAMTGVARDLGAAPEDLLSLLPWPDPRKGFFGGLGRAVVGVRDRAFAGFLDYAGKVGGTEVEARLVPEEPVPEFDAFCDLVMDVMDAAEDMREPAFRAFEAAFFYEGSPFEGLEGLAPEVEEMTRSAAFPAAAAAAALEDPRLERGEDFDDVVDDAVVASVSSAFFSLLAGKEAENV